MTPVAVRMTALEKLTMSRLEDRVSELAATVEELVGRVELLEHVAWATADACGALLVRVEDLEAASCRSNGKVSQ